MDKSVLECFPVLQVPLTREGGRKRLAYLDSAASTLKPRVLAEAISNYYLHNGTSVHRGVYELSQLATEEFEMSRRKIADFFNVDDNYTVIFTKGTTEAINIIAHGIDSELLGEGDEIVTTEIEHHANLVPWQQAAEVRGVRGCVTSPWTRGRVSLTVMRCGIGSVSGRGCWRLPLCPTLPGGRRRLRR